MAQLVDLWGLTRHDTLCDLDGAADSGPAGDSVLRRLRSDLDHDDSWVVWTTVVLAIAEVPNPRLEGRAVVLVHLLAVGLDRSNTGDGSPLAGGVEEAQVDIWVGLEVVGLAGLGVGVEDVVNAMALLS